MSLPEQIFQDSLCTPDHPLHPPPFTELTPPLVHLSIYLVHSWLHLSTPPPNHQHQLDFEGPARQKAFGWIQLCNLSFYHRTWHFVGLNAVAEEGIITRVEAKLGSPKRGAGSGPSFCGRLLGAGEQNQLPVTPGGTLLPETVRSTVFPVFLQEAGRHQGLSVQAWVQLGLGGRAKKSVPWRKGTAGSDWWLKQPMNTHHSRQENCRKSNGP